MGPEQTVTMGPIEVDRANHSIPRSVGLPEDLGDTALDVVLRAWLAVCDEQADTGEGIPTRSDLYDKVLEIEFSQWKKAPVLTKISTNHMRRAAATLSLLAPNQDEDEIDEVLSRLPEWEHEHLRRSRFAELLVHTLLHGDSGDTVSVRPDPVAEYLVLKVFGKKPDLLDQVLPSDPLEVPGIEDPDSDESVVQRALLLGRQSQNVCVALTRAAPLDPTRVRRLAGLALRARPYLWGCALDVALIQGAPSLTPWKKSSHLVLTYRSLRSKMRFRSDTEHCEGLPWLRRSAWPISLNATPSSRRAGPIVCPFVCRRWGTGRGRWGRPGRRWACTGPWP